ncbi:hypothetical protein [Singulisphaera sp. PoT]|uniref:hypothetical protein n=1 Tax=Singulisphaera sp. PoT TaxID=3411797 RepID=UPI003BF4DC20
MAPGWIVTLGFALVSAVAPSGRWVGQDGHDYTSMTKGVQPSGYQDMRFFLSGLPADREITKIVMTGDGGGLWNFPHIPNSAAIALARAPRSRTADLYVEPYCYEQGRKFFITLHYNDNSRSDIQIRGGKADPNLRMPDAAMVAKWLGQDGSDEVGTGIGVGPDGFQDIRLTLSKLDPEVEVKSIDIETRDRRRWQAGPNLKGLPSAEFVRDPKDRTKGDLYFQPEVSLGMGPIRLVVSYSNDRGDSATLESGRFEPSLATQKMPMPALVANTIEARWLGQDDSGGPNPGDVHIALSGLPTSPKVAHAVLNDGIQGNWIYRGDQKVPLHADPYDNPLTWKSGKSPAEADLYFSPNRDEADTTLLLRLVLADGSMTVVLIPGKACDLSKRAPQASGTSNRAKPGDDLYELVKTSGTLTLGPGTYRLAKPLILEHPIQLLGEPGSVLLFDQSNGGEPWSTAIKIHGSGTTLRGFQVRFAKAVRWRNDISYGPAIIGTTDNFDPGYGQNRIRLEFSNLDIESPPVANPQGWEESPRLLRLMNTSDVRIVKNRLLGGVIEFFGGPVECVDNDFVGTAAGTFSPGFIAGHFVHDLVVKGNRARQAPYTGKVWRFLILTSSGENVRIEGNQVVDVGPRDDDTIPWANSPEIVLTESYRLNFEGKLAGTSDDRRIVQVPKTQGLAPRAGDFVAVLEGPNAGKWRRIAQTLSPTAYLLNSPLPTGSEVVSIANGFKGFEFSSNTVDSRNGKRASNLVLAGNHFGSVVRGNRFVGGEAFRLLACPTEGPMTWGWSHTPFLSVVFEDNVVEDSPNGGVIDVQHAEQIKSNAGRTYLTVASLRNTVRWTDGFLREYLRAEKKTPPPGIRIGSTLSLDPGELVLIGEGDKFQAPAGTRPTEAMRVDSAMMNGRKVVKKAIILPATPPTP